MLLHDNIKVGRFRDNSSVVLHSDEAIKLITGITKESKSGKKTPLFGINNFGILVDYICQRTRLDDPYADMALIDLELMLNEANQLIDTLTTHVRKKLKFDRDKESKGNQLSHQQGINLCILESEKPYELALNDPKVFSTPYSFMLIQLIGQYDYFVRLLKTTREHGLINKKHYAEMHYRSNESLKRLFQRPYHYKDCQVTRQDILSGTETGKKAIQQLGELPLNIINGETSNEYGPTPQKNELH